MRFSIACALVLGALCFACQSLFAVVQPMVAPTAKSPKANVMHGQLVVSPEQPIVTVKLPSNPTTGFLWFWQPRLDANFITPMAYHFEPPQKKLPGAPGIAVWQFRIHKDAFVIPTALELKFRLARPWTTMGATEHVIFILTHPNKKPN